MTSKNKQHQGKLTNDQLDDIFAGGREMDSTIAISSAFLRDGKGLTEIAKEFKTTRQNVYARVTRTLQIAERKGVAL